MTDDLDFEHPSWLFCADANSHFIAVLIINIIADVVNATTRRAQQLGCATPRSVGPLRPFSLAYAAFSSPGRPSPALPLSTPVPLVQSETTCTTLCTVHPAARSLTPFLIACASAPPQRHVHYPTAVPVADRPLLLDRTPSHRTPMLHPPCHSAEARPRTSDASLSLIYRFPIARIASADDPSLPLLAHPTTPISTVSAAATTFCAIPSFDALPDAHSGTIRTAACLCDALCLRHDTQREDIPRRRAQVWLHA
ncbi:hypothetical protein B0H12DRAFT_437012 [Mycena haematopus]|nr:hypothetical protein B0H12DRAFT_437012 [Mycena haematopus]